MPTLQQVSASEIQKVELRVRLYSYGCERKIRKALSHFKGLHSIDVDFYQQKVTVIGLVNRDQVLAAMKAKRKNTRFWSAEDGNPELDMSGGSKGEIMEDSKKVAASSKKNKKEHLQAISNVVFQQYQTTSYKRAVWYADSEGDMSVSITTKEEVNSITLFSSDRRSISGISMSRISMSVCDFIRKAIYAIVTYCSKKDSF